MTTEGRSATTIQTEIDLVIAERAVLSGAEKGKLSKRLNALTAELAAVTKKRGRFADLDDRILALTRDPEIKDAKAVAAALGDTDANVNWRLMMLTKQGKLAAGQYWSPRSARTVAEVATPDPDPEPDEMAPTSPPA